MVYHWTNFVFECNAWWLRRVRPIWMGAFFIWSAGTYYRYYFVGKIQAGWQKKIPAEEWERRAQENKRNWGYNAIYKPTLARSRKKMLMEVLGDDYKFAMPYPERFMVDTRPLEEILEEEENWE